MRAREITEIVKIPKGEFTPGKSQMEKYNSELEKRAKPLPGGSGLKYVVDRNSKMLSIYILDPSGFLNRGDLVGQITLGSFPQFPIKNAWQVESAVVDPTYRGAGIGKSMYGVILSILKLTLIAGGDQTEGGRRSWLSLANIPGVEVSQVGGSTWSLTNLQAGVYKGVLRASSNSSNNDYPITLIVTSTIGLQENELNIVYEVYDWYGNSIYKGKDIPYNKLKGFYVIRYKDKAEKQTPFFLLL